MPGSFFVADSFDKMSRVWAAKRLRQTCRRILRNLKTTAPVIADRGAFIVFQKLSWSFFFRYSVSAACTVRGSWVISGAS